MVRALLTLIFGRAVNMTRHELFSRTRFYSSPPAIEPTNPTLYSIGFVKVFETQHGVLRVSNLPKRSARLAIAKGSRNTISEYLGVTEIFTSNVNLTSIKLVGDRKNDSMAR